MTGWGCEIRYGVWTRRRFRASDRTVQGLSFPSAEPDWQMSKQISKCNLLHLLPLASQESEGEQEDERAPAAASGTLRGRPANLKHGDRMLVVYIEKWGFKEGAGSFKEPQVALSVRDQDGESVEAVQVGAPLLCTGWRGRV